jgi:hypothetical protein
MMHRQADPRQAFLHVGAPKTGSTFLQALLWANRDVLTTQSVHMLGENQGQHYRAGHDLRGLPFDPADPGVDWTGAWDRMAERAEASEHNGVVISDEHLAALSPAQVDRAVTSLRPREVHVVYCTRDLPGLMPSEWQEFVKHGATATYDDWAEAVLSSAEEGPGRWFWRVHDVQSVVARWATRVAHDRIHVITMPESSAPRTELWRRFASVLGCDPDVIEDLPSTANPSLGPAAAEVLRRVNDSLPDDFPRWHRTGIVRDVLANDVLNPIGPPGRPRLRRDLADQVLERAELTRQILPTLGCRVVGSLSDLDPDRSRLDGEDAPSDDAVAELSVAALAGFVQATARIKDALIDERREAESRLRREHDEMIAAALAEQEAYFWQQHPMARRITTAKQRVVAAETGSRVVARGLDGYRRLRGSLRPRGDDGT